MKKILLMSSILLITLISNCGDGPDLKNTVLAAEAMERAKVAEAPEYAPKEYKVAKDLFDKMNKELGKEQYEDANNTALLVIDAVEKLKTRNDLRNTVLAAEAMKKVEAVEAPIYAPEEYQVAKNLFDRMNDELNQKLYKEANDNTALLVIEAANRAIRAARLAKSMEK